MQWAHLATPTKKVVFLIRKTMATPPTFLSLFLNTTNIVLLFSLVHEGWGCHSVCKVPSLLLILKFFYLLLWICFCIFATCIGYSLNLVEFNLIWSLPCLPYYKGYLYYFLSIFHIFPIIQSSPLQLFRIVFFTIHWAIILASRLNIHNVRVESDSQNCIDAIKAPR